MTRQAVVSLFLFAVVLFAVGMLFALLVPEPWNWVVYVIWLVAGVALAGPFGRWLYDHDVKMGRK